MAASIREWYTRVYLPSRRRLKEQRVTEEETKKKMSEAMNAPPSDFVKFWKLMDESAAETMQIKLYKNEGDEKPFRAIILVQGKTAVKEVLKLIDDREKNEA